MLDALRVGLGLFTYVTVKAWKRRKIMLNPIKETMALALEHLA